MEKDKETQDRIDRYTKVIESYITDTTEAQDIYNVLEFFKVVVRDAESKNEVFSIISQVKRIIRDDCIKNSICPRCGSALEVTGTRYPEINSFENVCYHCTDCEYEFLED